MILGGIEEILVRKGRKITGWAILKDLKEGEKRTDTN